MNANPWWKDDGPLGPVTLGKAWFGSRANYAEFVDDTLRALSARADASYEELVGDIRGQESAGPSAQDHRAIVAWIGPDGQLMPHEVYLAWVEVRKPPDADQWDRRGLWG